MKVASCPPSFRDSAFQREAITKRCRTYAGTAPNDPSAAMIVHASAAWTERFRRAFVKLAARELT